MATGDWFRRSTWTEADQKAFFERLGRSRTTYHKSQYARIQAQYLQDAGLVQEALDLLQRVQDEWPDPSQLAAAHAQEARCHLERGDLESAVTAFRQCLEVEDEHGLGTNARVEFAWLAATRRLSDLYDEVIGALDHESAAVLLPVDRYRVAAARALIFGERGDSESARQMATVALEAAQQPDTGHRIQRWIQPASQSRPGRTLAPEAPGVRLSAPKRRWMPTRRLHRQRDSQILSEYGRQCGASCRA